MRAVSAGNGRTRPTARITTKAPKRRPRHAPVRVKRMIEAHVAEVAQLFLSHGVCRRDCLRQRIKTALAATPGLSIVAELDGRVVGAALACFDGFHVHISNFAVDEDFQRCGIGTRLHRAIERRARRCDAQAIAAGAWMTATGFYHELGYRTPGVVYLVNDL